MKPTQYTFRRKENKYLLDRREFAAVMRAMSPRLRPDAYPEGTVCSVYYDTPDFRLIRTCLDKPAYREKLRMRSYGVPEAYDPVFVEIKKKFKGVVYKRRASMPYVSACGYLDQGIRTAEDSQILREIDWFFSLYGKLEPKRYVAYDRLSFVDRRDESLRITFDRNVRCRDYDLALGAGDHGDPLLPEGTVVMEAKISGSSPKWMARMLSELGILPRSFSKYGTSYSREVRRVHAVAQQEAIKSA